MSSYKYDYKSNLFYKTESELLCFKNEIKMNVDLNNNPEIKNIINWKSDFIGFLNNPNQKFYDRRLEPIIKLNDAFSFKLNISSFSSGKWEGIEEWRRNLLFDLDKFLYRHDLILKKKISVQFIGSLGSFDPIYYSDFDCILILPLLNLWDEIELAQLKDLYKTLNYYAYLFDPYQHHDVFIITEAELLGGVPTFYPLELLKLNWGYGRSFFNYAPKNNSPVLNSMNFIRSTQSLRKLNYHGSSPNSMYLLKYLLSTIYLLPTYFWNSKKLVMSKSEAIKDVIGLGQEIQNDFFWVSNFRSKWSKSNPSFLKRCIFKFGIDYFETSTLNYFYRRLNYHFIERIDNHRSLLNDSKEIIRKGNRISDALILQLFN